MCVSVCWKTWVLMMHSIQSQSIGALPVFSLLEFVTPSSLLYCSPYIYLVDQFPCVQPTSLFCHYFPPNGCFSLWPQVLRFEPAPLPMWKPLDLLLHWPPCPVGALSSDLVLGLCICPASTMWVSTLICPPNSFRSKVLRKECIFWVGSIRPKLVSTQYLWMWPYLQIGFLQM